jgi:hypothetical protein
MNRTAFKTCLALASTVTFSVQAMQQCAPGQTPQGDTCVSSVRPQAYAGNQAWVSQWQAIAGDRRVRALGTSKGLMTPEDAQSAALNDCRFKGGRHCTVYVTRGNGCVAMAQGDQTFWIATGNDLAAAETEATSTCSRGDQGCSVIYSNCSLPARVQ